MDIQLIRTDGLGFYSLFVNGKCYVKDESFTVCDNVRESLKSYGYRYGFAECDEVAAGIALDLGLS